MSCTRSTQRDETKRRRRRSESLVWAAKKVQECLCHHTTPHQPTNAMPCSTARPRRRRMDGWLALELNYWPTLIFGLCQMALLLAGRRTFSRSDCIHTLLARVRVGYCDHWSVAIFVTVWRICQPPVQASQCVMGYKSFSEASTRFSWLETVYGANSLPVLSS